MSSMFTALKEALDDVEQFELDIIWVMTKDTKEKYMLHLMQCIRTQMQAIVIFYLGILFGYQLAFFRIELLFL